jgi:hypothetical protein
MDEASSIRYDFTPNHLDLEDIGGVGSIEGKFGGAAQFLSLPDFLTSVIVLPEDSSLALGSSLQFEATAFYESGASLDCSSLSSWDSSSGSIASVSSLGVALGLFAGDTVISAEYQSVEGSASLLVFNNPDFTENLAVWWKMDEGTGEFVYDSTTNHNDAQWTGTIDPQNWVAGRGGSGGAIALRGSTNPQVSVRQSGAVTPLVGLPVGNAAISLCCWYRLTTTAPADHQQSVIFGYGKNSGTGCRYNIWLNFVGSPKLIGLEIYNGGIFFPVPLDLLWHHIAVVWPGGNVALSNVQIYIDDVLQTDVYGYVEATPNIPNEPNENCITSGEVPFYFEPAYIPYAEVDDCRIYTVALSSDNVHTIFTATPAV